MFDEVDPVDHGQVSHDQFKKKKHVQNTYTNNFWYNRKTNLESIWKSLYYDIFLLGLEASPRCLSLQDIFVDATGEGNKGFIHESFFDVYKICWQIHEP